MADLPLFTAVGFKCVRVLHDRIINDSIYDSSRQVQQCLRSNVRGVAAEFNVALMQHTGKTRR